MILPDYFIISKQDFVIISKYTSLPSNQLQIDTSWAAWVRHRPKMPKLIGRRLSLTEANELKKADVEFTASPILNGDHGFEKHTSAFEFTNHDEHVPPAQKQALPPVPLPGKNISASPPGGLPPPKKIKKSNVPGRKSIGTKPTVPVIKRKKGVKHSIWRFLLFPDVLFGFLFVGCVTELLCMCWTYGYHAVRKII